MSFNEFKPSSTSVAKPSLSIPIIATIIALSPKAKGLISCAPNFASSGRTPGISETIASISESGDSGINLYFRATSPILIAKRGQLINLGIQNKYYYYRLTSMYMEEPELRIGGWVQQKKRGKVRRLFSFLLIITVGLIVGGPALVSYQNVNIDNGSLYLNAGVWNGPFENENTKEFNGHLKISKESYESLDGESGKLIILSLSSLINLENLNYQNIVVNKVKQQMANEGLELQSNGNILTEVNPVLPLGTSIYQWTAKTTDDSIFFNSDYDDELFVKVYSWSLCTGLLEEFDCNAIISIAIGVAQKDILQATDLIENVRL